MGKRKKDKKEKDITLSLLTNFYELFEGYSFENLYFKYLIMYIYFFQTISYLYFFLLKDEKKKTALYFSYFHYFLNFSSLINVLNYWTIFVFFFFLCFGINVILSLYAIYNMFLFKLKIRVKQKNKDSFQKTVNFLCDIYNRFILIPAIDIFLFNFQRSGKFFDENSFINSQTIKNLDIVFKALGIIGLIISLILSLLFLYLNQDYRFLDKTKFRSNFNLMVLMIYTARIIQTIIFRTDFELELLQYIATYVFLLVALYSYLTEFPFRNSKISKCYISVLLYSLMNVILLSLYRVGYVKTEKDLFVDNLIMSVISFKLGHAIYEKYYTMHMIQEKNDVKITIFTLEELMDLYINEKTRAKFNLIFYGHLKIKFNEMAPEDKRSFLVDYIYANLCDFITKKQNKKDANKLKINEMFYAKYLTFLFFNGINPIKNYYEYQKILYEKTHFSYYFSTSMSVLGEEIKKQIKFRSENNNNYDSRNTIIKNTYNEYFRASSIKSKLEKRFKNIVNQKIVYFEKTNNGQQTLEHFFLANMKFSPLIKKFKTRLKNLNANSSFCNILKYKFLSLLYSMILNNFSKAILYDRKFQEEFTSKNNEMIDKSYMDQFFDNDTIICEASFLHSAAGKILEKSKTKKLFSFFGYEDNERDKIKFVNDLVPVFVREKHETFVSNYLNQRSPPNKAQIQTFAVDKQCFVFPIFVSFTLKHDYQKDFVLASVIRKVKDYEQKFCLINFDGKILNISQEFFSDLKQEYEFLEVADVGFINIFQLVPELSHYLQGNDENLNTKRSQTSKLYFPDKMKEIIEFAKLKEREEKEQTMSRRKTFTKISEESSLTNSKKRTISKLLQDSIKNFKHRASIKKDYAQNINTYSDDGFIQGMFNQQHFKKAEIKFDIIFDRISYGSSAEEKILYGVFIVKEYKKPKSIEQKVNANSPENILNTTLFDSRRKNEPKVIHVLANDNFKRKGFGFKCKVEDLKGPQFRKSNKDKEKEVLTGISMLYYYFYYKLHLFLESKSFDASKEGANREKKGRNLTNQMSVSSYTDMKSESLIFATIKNIKNSTPKSLKALLLILVAQIPILIIFGLVYRIIGGYITNYFKPTQNSLFDFCQQYHYNSAMMLANIRFEYFSLGLIDPIERKEYQILKSIYKTSFKHVSIISYNNRVSENEVTFHKKLIMLYVDPLTLQFSNIQYIEFIDIILNQIQNLLPQLLNFDYNGINDANLIFFQRNFPYFSLASSNINFLLQAELYTSNIPVFDDMKNAMIIFLMLYLFVKLIEIYFWNNFIKSIRILLMIFSRTNETEISQTITILKDFQKVFVDTTDSYFKTSVSDTIITKKENVTDQENKAKVKKDKKKSLTRFTTFPKYGLFAYFISSAFLFGFYFFYNYYNWYTIDKYIVKLITLDQVFVNNFLYTSAAINLEDNLIREKIIDNPAYTQLNDTYQKQATYQTKSARIDYFKTNLDKRIVAFGNTSAEALINNGLEILKEHDSKNLTLIMKENLCLFLVDYNDIKLESDEFLLCEKLLNGAFKQGISNVVTELIQKLKSREVSYQMTETQNDKIEQQKLKIKEYVASFDFVETFFSNFFLHMVLEHYYEMNNDYFYGLLDEKISAFDTFLLASMFITSLIVLILVKLIQTKVVSAFKNNCLVLSIIPSERLIYDEQIFFFLKKYLRNNE